ncbi:MAG: hypothetical protein HZA07_00145 [Nitrospirae bacterium]|nr:hypothetical protein [Nitrospirota bacterium]
MVNPMRGFLLLLLLGATASSAQDMLRTELSQSEDLKKLNALIPHNWSMRIEDNKLIITSAELYWTYNASNMPYSSSEQDMEAYVKEIGHQTKYEVYLEFENRWSDAKIQSMRVENDKIYQKIDSLKKKYRESWKPRNQKFLKELEELKRKIQRLPDFNTERYSIFMSDNIPEVYQIWHDDTVMRDKPYRFREMVKELLSQK